MASESPSSSAKRGHSDDERRGEEQEELAREPAQQPVDRAGEEPGCRQRQREEQQRLEDDPQRLAEPAAAAAGEAEHDREDDVLEDEDRKDEIRLVVGETAEVDQALDGHGARGDVDRGGDDQRGEAEPECGDPDDEAERGVHEQVDRPAETDVPAAPRESLQAELEAEEEEEEDEPELGHEVRHLGRLDHAQQIRLVRAQQEPCEQVRRDRGEPDAACQKPEPAEDGNGDGELGEGHLAASLSSDVKSHGLAGPVGDRPLRRSRRGSGRSGTGPYDASVAVRGGRGPAPTTLTRGSALRAGGRISSGPPQNNPTVAPRLVDVDVLQRRRDAQAGHRLHVSAERDEPAGARVHAQVAHRKPRSRSARSRAPGRARATGASSPCRSARGRGRSS